MHAGKTLALKACQKLAAPKAVRSELEAPVGIPLGLEAKRKELRQVDGLLTVVVDRVPAGPDFTA